MKTNTDCENQPESPHTHELRECRSACGTKALTSQASTRYFRMRAIQYLYDNRSTNRYYSVREIAKHPDERRQIYRALSRLHAKSGYVMRRKIKISGITHWKLDRSKTCLAKAKEELAYMHLQPALEPKHEEAEADRRIDKEKQKEKEDESAAAAKALACMIEQKNTEIQSLEEKIRGLEGTVSTLESKNQCFRSDFDSYRQRAEKEKEKNRNDMKRDNAKQMLEIADSLDRAAAKRAGAGNLDMIHDMLLYKLNFVPVVPQAKGIFDDEKYTAIDTAENNELPENTVISIVRKGYMLDGELIRPAEVIVSKKRDAGTGNDNISRNGGFFSSLLRAIKEKIAVQARKPAEVRQE